MWKDNYALRYTIYLVEFIVWCKQWLLVFWQTITIIYWKICLKSTVVNVFDEDTGQVN